MADAVDFALLDAVVARTLSDLTHFNTLVLSEVRVRFQIAPGEGPGLGIDGALFKIRFNGVVFRQGTTSADGEISIPLASLLTGKVLLEFLGTDYDVSLRAFPDGKLSVLTSVGGQQQRLEVLGYLTGYLLRDFLLGKTDRANPASPDPANTFDDAPTQQAIMNFQMDHHLSVDGGMGPKSQTALKKAAKE